MTTNRLQFLAYGWLLIAVVGWAQPSTDPCIERGLVTSLGQRLTNRYVVTREEETVSITQAQAAHIRVRIVLEEAGNCPWHLVLRDRAFRAIQTLDAQSLTLGSPVWSTRISGDRVYLDLTDCVGGAWPKIVSDQQVWMPEFAKLPFYSIQGTTPRWTSIEDHESRIARRLGDIVGFLVGLGSTEQKNWGCSGVMIGPDLFLTNWHCISPLQDQSSTSLQSLVIDMSWDKDQVSRDYQVVALETGSSDLDFAILRVQPLTALGPARYIRLREVEPMTGAVQIVHHPEGRRKQISAECRIRETHYPTANSPFLSHDCDTEAGSSGAPLFNGQQVVGLHHCGFQLNATDKKNRAVRIDRILQLVKKEKQNLYERLVQ